jgi:hypothetical protein
MSILANDEWRSRVGLQRQDHGLASWGWWSPQTRRKAHDLDYCRNNQSLDSLMLLDFKPMTWHQNGGQHATMLWVVNRGGFAAFVGDPWHGWVGAEHESPPITGRERLSIAPVISHAPVRERSITLATFQELNAAFANAESWGDENGARFLALWSTEVCGEAA